MGGKRNAPSGWRAAKGREDQSFDDIDGFPLLADTNSDCDRTLIEVCNPGECPERAMVSTDAMAFLRAVAQVGGTCSMPKLPRAVHTELVRAGIRIELSEGESGRKRWAVNSQVKVVHT